MHRSVFVSSDGWLDKQLNDVKKLWQFLPTKINVLYCAFWLKNLSTTLTQTLGGATEVTLGHKCCRQYFSVYIVQKSLSLSCYKHTGSVLDIWSIWTIWTELWYSPFSSNNEHVIAFVYIFPRDSSYWLLVCIFDQSAQCCYALPNRWLANKSVSQSWSCVFAKDVVFDRVCLSKSNFAAWTCFYILRKEHFSQPNDRPWNK